MLLAFLVLTFFFSKAAKRPRISPGPSPLSLYRTITLTFTFFDPTRITTCFSPFVSPFKVSITFFFFAELFTSLTSLEEILTASVTAFLLFCAFTIRTIFVFRPFFKTTLFFFTDSFFTLFCTFTLTTAFTTLPAAFFDCNTREAADPLTAF